MIADVAGLVVSLVLLAVAGDQFVVGLARVARALRVRPMVVGLVVGGIGTSVADLLVAWLATARGDHQIALGGMVGSIIVNISLGLAVAALVTPIRVDTTAVRREAPLSTAGVLLLAALAATGINLAKGAVLAGVLVGAMGILVLNARRGTPQDELSTEVTDFFEQGARPRTAPEAARSLLAAVVMVGAADLLVRSASALAIRLGVAEGAIGLTIVALGTSTPLVVSSIQAARRGDHDLVVGDVLGCNLFIALGGGGIIGLVGGHATVRIGLGPLWLMAAVSVAAWASMARRSTVTRVEATLLLLAYLVSVPFLAR